MRCATSGRCRPQNFTANRCRTRRDLVGEPDGGCTIFSPEFCDFRPFSGHFRPPHSSFPPFLDLLNSSMWSLFTDFVPFGSYNKNEIGRSLDWVFRPPQRLLDQGNGTNEFWSLGLSIDMWFVNFGRCLVSFPFLGCFGKLPRSRD